MDKIEQYCLYLRKSRADDEGEKLSESETLSRHKNALIDLAKRQGLTITGVYEEIGSAETIADRPKMQQLLEDVENGMWTGVLIVKIDRLARGDEADQSRITKTFRYSNTKIVTPYKTFDLNNKFDLKYFTFSLFMSREEYGFITERLQDGRIYSVIEGKYPGNKEPLGYKRMKLTGEKGWTLEIDHDSAGTIRLIYDLYVNGIEQPDGTAKRLGVSLIARRLNELKIPTKTGGNWVVASVRDILINPVYNGKIRWNWRANKKSMEKGQEISSRPRANIDDCLIAKGRHEAIIDDYTFAKAQEYMKKNPPRPVGERHKVTNPLAGIVICSKCGRRMTRRPYGNKGYPDTLICADPQCKTVSVHLHYVETRILEGLADWLQNYKLEWKLDEKPKKKSSLLDAKRKTLNKLDEELELLDEQRKEAHNLIERRIYTDEMFFDRMKELGELIQKAKTDRAAIEADMQIEGIREESRKNIIPAVERLIETYHELQTAEAKNDLLKEVLEKVVYTKDAGGRWNGKPDDFTIELFPKLPASQAK